MYSPMLDTLYLGHVGISSIACSEGDRPSLYPTSLFWLKLLDVFIGERTDPSHCNTILLIVISIRRWCMSTWRSLFTKLIKEE